MLQNLHVKNLALIDEAEVDFEPGLNILTGETGAGKSIIIGSIGLALGGRVSKEIIREGAPFGLVELVFSIESEKQKKALEEMGIVSEEDVLVLSRKIVNGRSISKINGESVPISKVKEAASLFIDIHGQHEHQSLLMKKNHLNILDSYAKNDLWEAKEKLKASYGIYKKLKEKLQEANLDASGREREISFLSFEADEIERASLTAGEDEELEKEYKKLANGQKILEAVTGAYEQTGGGYDSATDRLGHALKNLSSVSEYDGSLAVFENQLMEIDNLLNDFNREIADYISDASFDEETFIRTEERLNAINRLKAKYGRTIEEILQSLQQKRERLDMLLDYDTYLSDLKNRFCESEKEIKYHAKTVSGIRKRAAEELEGAVLKELLDLNFPDVSFSMEFQTLDECTANGCDDVEFLLSANPGEPLKPLEKIASGGELSRIMLAVKTVLADTDAVGTQIFDEIDTGISGRTAQMVSEKMSRLGRSRQVICITHLPQIAAMADSHFLIEKSVENKTAVSTIRRLEEEESAEELARMLGGVKITDTVLQNAREMKELAANTKKSLGERK